MPRRAKTQTVFNWGTLVNILTIPVLTGGIYFLGDWFRNGDTLKRHDIEIAAEVKARENAEKNQSEQREKLSESLLSYAQKTQEGISTLSAHAMVQDEQIKNITSTLDHVVSGLQGIERAVGNAPDTSKFQHH